MEKESKIFWIIGIVTVLIIGIGAYFLSRPPKPESETPSSKVDSKLLVKSDSNIKKAPKEKAILVEFGDFQCPACASYSPIVDQVLKEFENELTFVARHYPLPQHKNALQAAYAAEAVARQGKYWEMYDLLYKNQDDWENLGKPMEIFENYVKDLNLDLEKFKTDANLKEIKDKVQSDLVDGKTLGVNSTPSFFLQNEKIKAPRSVDEFKSLVKSAIENSTAESKSNGDEVYHAHFDLKIILEGKPLDLSLEKYHSDKDHSLSESTHMHDLNGEVVHLHAPNIKLSSLFESFKIQFNNECFTLDTGVKYCNDNGEALKMFVNGKENKDFENYEPKDLDRILISYGSDGEGVVQKQIDSVTDKACIYSETCPERGKPPTEECVGGLGSGCEEE